MYEPGHKQGSLNMFIYDCWSSWITSLVFSNMYILSVENTAPQIYIAWFQEIISQVPKPVTLVDLGCGNCDKTRMFIDAILETQDRLDFIPVDISEG